MPGGGSWSANLYASTTKRAIDSGTTFRYSTETKSTKPPTDWKAHDTLDPKSVNKEGPNKDKNIREAFDSDEHPNSTPIAVIFDVTGSMGRLPGILQKKLPELHGLLLVKGYVDDPQILFGAVGDAYSDRVPLQISQFESDNRMDEHLENTFLEGGGGGGNHESYDLAAYFMANHVDLDSLKKRNKKGYLFFIGDERLYPRVDRKLVEQYIGDTLQEDMPVDRIFKHVSEKFETFFLFAAEGSYEPENVLGDEKGHYGSGESVGWRSVLGQNALIMEKAEAVCETIALTIGLMEGSVSYEDGMADLEEVSTDLSAVKAAGKALAAVGAGTASVAETTGSDIDLGGESGSERL